MTITTTSSADTIVNQSTDSTWYQYHNGLLERIKIVVSYQKQLPILHLLEIKFLKKYLMNDVENSTSELLGFKIFWGSIPPTP